MGFKVVNIFPLPGLDFGDELLDPLDATLEKGMSMTEEEIISRAHDADAIIGVVSVHPFNRHLLAARPLGDEPLHQEFLIVRHGTGYGRYQRA